MKTFLLLACALLLLTTFGCGAGKTPLTGPAQSPDSPTTLGLPPPVVARVQQQVRTDIERYVAAQQASALQALSASKAFPAAFKLPLVVQGLSDPWMGMIALEIHGYRIAALAKAGRENLPALIEAMEAGMARTPDAITFLPMPTGENPEEYVTYLLAVIEQAHQLREKALRRLSPEERQFLFAHAASLAQHFFPYFEGLDGQTRPQAEADRRFCQLVSARLDYAAMAAAALASADWAFSLTEQATIGTSAPGSRRALRSAGWDCCWTRPATTCTRASATRSASAGPWASARSSTSPATTSTSAARSTPAAITTPMRPAGSPATRSSSMTAWGWGPARASASSPRTVTNWHTGWPAGGAWSSISTATIATAVPTSHKAPAISSGLDSSSTWPATTSTAPPGTATLQAPTTAWDCSPTTAATTAQPRRARSTTAGRPGTGASRSRAPRPPC